MKGERRKLQRWEEGKTKGREEDPAKAKRGRKSDAKFN
jgi:hypothetical protein